MTPQARTGGSTGRFPQSGSSAPFQTPNPGWSLNRPMTFRGIASRRSLPAGSSASSFRYGMQYSPARAVASSYGCSCSIACSSQLCPTGPVRMKLPPASCSSRNVSLPCGVFDPGGGGIVKPIGSTARPFTLSTPFGLIWTFDPPLCEAVASVAVSDVARIATRIKSLAPARARHDNVIMNAAPRARRHESYRRAARMRAA